MLRVGVWWVAVVVASSGCELVKEAGEEIEGEARDHNVLVITKPILIGGSNTAEVRDGCTSADHPECETQSVTVTGVTASTGVTAGAVGNGIFYTSKVGGSISVSVMFSDGRSGSGSGSVIVVAPEEARVDPACPSQTAITPFLIGADRDVKIGWQYYLDGNPEFGNTGKVPAIAPGFELLETRASNAIFHAPVDPGLVTITSSIGDSSFEYQLFPVDQASVTTAQGIQNYFRTGFLLHANAVFEGRVSCQNPGSLVLTSETPDVCLVGRTAWEHLVTVDTDLDHAELVPLVAGTCRVAVAIVDTPLTGVFEQDVVPTPLADQRWTATCVPSGGTTCGVRCPLNYDDEKGCDWHFTEEIVCNPNALACKYELSEPKTGCPATTERPADESGCW